MATAYEVIKSALTLCGAQQIGEAPEAAIAQMGLDLLNGMRAQWSTEGLSCFTETSVDFTPTGARSYLFGDGIGAIAARPYEIREVYYVVGQSVQSVDAVSFENIQGTPSGIVGTPRFWAWDGALESNLYLYPQPNANTIRVVYSTPLGQIANLSDTITDPLEYGEPTRFNLATRLCAALGIEPSGSVQAIAAKSYERIRNAAAKRRPNIFKSDVPTARYGGFSILTDSYNNAAY